MQAARQLRDDNEHEGISIAGRAVEILTRREGAHFVSEVRCAASGKLLARGEGPARVEAEVIARAKAEDLISRGAPGRSSRSADGKTPRGSLCPTA